MKKIIALSILSFIVCTAFNKPTILVTDYRDAYIGKYFCKSVCSKKDDTNGKIQNSYRNDTISIVISKDATDSVLQVKLSAQVLKVKLHNNYMRSYSRGVHCGGKFFATDSLDFNFTPGLASSCRYLGKKQ
jgi:hypothetical protein